MHFPTVPVAHVPVEDSLANHEDHRPVILVADDEAVIADTLSAILSMHGYAPMTAHSGAAAMELAALVTPDLLITDVVMPGMSGVELAMNIRRQNPGCGVLLFSGQAETLDLLQPARLAGHDFMLIAKPVAPAELLKHIASCLADGEAGDMPSSQAGEHHRSFRSGRHAAYPGRKIPAFAY